MLFKYFNLLWWKFVPGKEIVVMCPTDLVQIPHPFYSHTYFIESLAVFSKENSKKILEQTVGIQGLDWDWRIVENNKLKIKFRIGKTRYASYFLIKWN